MTERGISEVTVIGIQPLSGRSLNQADREQEMNKSSPSRSHQRTATEGMKVGRGSWNSSHTNLLNTYLGRIIMEYSRVSGNRQTASVL